jgi:hypothetical protein
MSDYTINGWEKLKGIHQLFNTAISSVNVDVNYVEVIDITSAYALICPQTFVHINQYRMKFKIYHPSRGTSNELQLVLKINSETGKCEIKVTEGESIVYHNWIGFGVVRDKFQTPIKFLSTIVELINKQHKYFII